ncbi:MAG: response regulator transcription factor [Bacteroidia bacterium]|nr:response regulator transcription factor [Bacteroidia bacterium]
MNENPKLLYVEDDVSLAFVTRDNLHLQGFDVTHCTDGMEALNTFRNKHFDLCIVDVMLPKMDGFELAQKIRMNDPHVPIIFLTAKSLQEDKIHGLRIGGDDYMIKPFSIEELVLKVKVFLKRRIVKAAEDLPTKFNIGNYLFKYDDLQISCNGIEKRLTQREADVLRLLSIHKNQIVKREIILREIWGEDDYFHGRSLDVFISRLRKYLNLDPNVQIENIHSVGFKLKTN